MMDNSLYNGKIEVSGEAKAKVMQDCIRVMVSLNFDTSDISEGIANIGEIYSQIKEDIYNIDKNGQVEILNTMVRKSSNGESGKASLFKTRANGYVFSSIAIKCRADSSVKAIVTKQCDRRASDNKKIQFIYNIRSWYEVSSELIKSVKDSLINEAVGDSYKKAINMALAINNISNTSIAKEYLHTVKSLIITEIRVNTPFLGGDSILKKASNQNLEMDNLMLLEHNDSEYDIGDDPIEVEIQSSVYVTYTIIYD